MAVHVGLTTGLQHVEQFFLLVWRQVLFGLGVGLLHGSPWFGAKAGWQPALRLFALAHLRLLALNRYLLCCVRVDDLDGASRASDARWGDCNRLIRVAAIYFDTRTMFDVWVHDRCSTDRCFLWYGVIVRCRSQLWKGSERAIAVGSLVLFAIIYRRVDRKVGRNRQPISEAVLVSLRVTELETVRVLSPDGLAGETESNSGCKRQNALRIHDFLPCERMAPDPSHASQIQASFKVFLSRFHFTQRPKSDCINCPCPVCLAIPSSCRLEWGPRVGKCCQRSISKPTCSTLANPKKEHEKP